MKNRFSLAAASMLTFGALMVPTTAVAQSAGTAANGRGDRPRNQTATAKNASVIQGNGINYHGGPVVRNTVNVYFIWYGNWSQDSAANAILTYWAQNIGGSPYMSIATTYGDTIGNVSGSVAYAGSTADAGSFGTSLQDSNVTSIVLNTLSSGQLPTDANGVYYVLTAPGVQTTGFLTQYCGWHSYASLNGLFIKYAFVGDPAGPSIGSCAVQTSSSPNADPPVDAMVSVMTHELEETLSDPQFNAWFDADGDESADKCAWTFGATYAAAGGGGANMKLGIRDFLIQQNWVNANGGYCALSVPSPSVGITAPTGGNVSGNVNVTANATAPGGMASLQFQLDGANLGSALAGAGPNFSTSWATAASSNGSHALTAIATDNIGQSTTSSAVTVNLANGPYLLTSAVAPSGAGSISASPPSTGGYFSAGTGVQLTAAAVSGCTFINWTGALTGSTNPQTLIMSGPKSVTANFQCGGPTSTAFLTGYALNNPSVRSDFTGWVGMKLTVGANPLTVSTLGRICVANNAQTHVVKFVNVSDGSDVAGASVSLNMAGCTPNQFAYGTISPVTLPAGTSYYLVSQETQGGDQWYDGGAITATNVAVVNSAVYSYNGVWYPIGAANTSYVPPNFQYSVVTPAPISVTVQASPAGPSFTVDGSTSTTAQALTWTSGTSHAIATTSPQSAGVGAQYAWSGWSDGGAISHTVAPAGNITYTASFTTQYLLTTNVSPAGSGSISAGGYYTSGTSAQLTATPVAGCTFQNWGGALSGAANPQPVTMSAPQSVTANFQCSGPPPAGFLTGYALNGPSLRNDFTGWVGMKLTVGANPLTISALGRICVANNAQTHMVKFVNVSDGGDVAGASASIGMAGCTTGQFVYQAISPATLTAGTSYYLVSQETQGGDQWYDGGAIAATNVAVVNSAVYSYNGVWFPIGAANTSYVPPNFQYSVVTPAPITVTVAANPTGPSFSADGSTYTAAQTLAWTSGTSHTIATTSPQSAGAGTQYAWSGWSDGGAISHTVAPASGSSYTASFTTQYLLTTNVSPAGSGSVSAGGYYNSGTSVQLTAAPSAGCTFQSWGGALGGSANPQPVTMSSPQSVTANFQCSGPPPAGFITGYALSGQSLRNDFTGWVGMKLTVGGSPLTVSALGRICVANNVQTHTVKFVNAGDGSDVAGASVSVNMAGCTPNQFAYASITPITLAAGSSFYQVSQETQNGDQWYDQSGVSANNVAAVNSGVYSYNGVWYPIGAANTSYVPPNFQYSVVTPSPISVTVQASPAGPSFTVDGSTSTTSQTLTWTSGTSHTIATTSPQSAGAGTQYAWSGWSDGGAISHTVAPASGSSYTASFTTQYLLTTSVSPAGSGSVSAGGYYNSGTPVTLTATPSTGCTFQNWSGALSGTANSQSVTMAAPQSVTANFQCSGPPPAGFVTGYALNGPSLRNDFTGWVGMKLTVGANPLTVSALGRICVTNNTQTHPVKFVNAGDGNDVASASVNMAGCTVGQFVYQAIGPVILTPGASYYLVSQETQSGDRWYDQGAISTNTDAAVNSAVYFYNGVWYPLGAGNTSYVPPNFQYSVAGP